jgi:integrase
MESMGPPHRDGKRKRVLRGDELRAVWLASDAMGEPIGSFVKMLLLTGQRLREVAGASWSEINLDTAEWVIPAERAKNNRDHLCPLSPQVIDLLKARFPSKADRKGLLFTTTGKTPISGFSKSKARLDSEVGKALTKISNADLQSLQPWVYHDLRRSFSTGCQALGFPIEHTEACLNHVSGKRGGLAAIYQLHEYKLEKTAVMATWGRHVDGLVQPEVRSNVVSLAVTTG